KWEYLRSPRPPSSEMIIARPALGLLSPGIREYREENVDNIIDDFPAIVRKGCRAARVIGKNVWQQLRTGVSIRAPPSATTRRMDPHFRTSLSIPPRSRAVD